MAGDSGDGERVWGGKHILGILGIGRHNFGGVGTSGKYIFGEWHNTWDDEPIICADS